MIIKVNCLLQAEKIATLLKTANVECESYWPSLFAKLAEKKNIEDLIMNVGVGGAGGGAAAVAAPAAGGAAAAAAPAVEEKKVRFHDVCFLVFGLYEVISSKGYLCLCFKLWSCRKRPKMKKVMMISYAICLIKSFMLLSFS